MPAKLDLLGQTFGRATVVGEATPTPAGRRRVECVCACGERFACEPRSLKCGDTSSCGCLQREAVSASAKEKATHGRAGTTEYSSWLKLRSRCENPNNPKYDLYGGRGITFDPRWNDFDAFFSDMGEKPDPTWSIDRIDVNKGYGPENCRWASRLTQARNKQSHRTVEYQGQSMPLSEACAKAGVNYRSALYRLNRGGDWLLARAVAAQPRVDGAISSADLIARTDYAKGAIDDRGGGRGA